MRKIIMLERFALIAALLAISAMPVQGEVLFNQVNHNVPGGAGFYCNGNGDTMNTIGTVHRIYGRTENDNHLSVSRHQNTHASGVGQDTGYQYQISTTDNSTGSFNNNNSQLTGTSVFNLGIISEGPGTNFHVHGVSHTTTNAHGEVVVNSTRLKYHCK